MLVTFLKILVLAALAPIWWPILKELHREVEAALLEEGGLLGRRPTRDELAERREKYKDYQDPLVSQPWAEARAEAEAARRDRGRSKKGPRASSQAPAAPAAGRPGPPKPVRPASAGGGFRR